MIERLQHIAIGQIERLRAVLALGQERAECGLAVARRPDFAGIAERRYLRSDRIARLLERAYGREPTAEEVEGYFAPLRRPGTALAIMNGYAARWPETPRGEDLDRVPSLILWGENDAWVKPEVADRLQAALPSARRVTVAGAGHCPMETHAAPTADAVLAHFAAAPALARTTGTTARR